MSVTGAAPHVLIVDDNAINRRLVERLLARHAVRTTVVEDGLKAIDATGGESFDLVLMDCNMPVIDGWEATRQIRAREASAGGGARLPIVAVTAQAMPGDRERCLAAGMDDYIVKPVSGESLEAVLRKFTSLAPEAAPAVTATFSTPDIDDERFGELERDFDREDVVALVEEFLESAPGQLQAMTDSRDGGDLAALRAASHRLRGGCLAIGLGRVASAAGMVEEDIAAGRGGDALKAVDLVLERWESGAAALRARIAD